MFNKKFKLPNSFSNFYNEFPRLELNNSLDNNIVDYRNNKNLGNFSSFKNVIYGEFKKIKYNKDIFDQFSNNLNKENLYLGSKINVSFTKR